MKENLLLILGLGLLAILGTLSTVAEAEEKRKIYKYTDENGVTHYTETKPNDNYEEADLPPLSIVPSTPIKSQVVQPLDEETVDPSVVEVFSIVSPVNEQNIWGSGGKLTAQVQSLTPPQEQIYQVQFVIDGQKRQAADDSTQVFEGIYRGEHTVKALLVNRFNKKVIKETQTVTFFMHQNSKK